MAGLVIATASPPIGPALAKTPGGIRPDCSERPLSVDELLALGEKATSKNEFLKSIPPGSMQTFTLVPHSQSRHAEAPFLPAPDTKFPRVIRSNADGSLVIAYVCNPASQAVEEVEILSYDKKAGELKPMLLNFGPMRIRRVPPETLDCARCHTGGVPGQGVRHNHGAYHTWDGFWGETDDNLDPAQQGEFETFRKAQKDNPCYSSLPWPKSKDPAMAHYPYYTDPHKRRTYLRPNFRLGIQFAVIQADSVYTRLRKAPRFEALAPLLLSQASGCFIPPEVLEGHLRSIDPSLAGVKFSRDAIQEFAGQRGIDESQFGLHFNKGGFWTAGETDIGDIVEARMLEDIAKTSAKGGLLMKGVIRASETGIMDAGGGPLYPPDMACWSSKFMRSKFSSLNVDPGSSPKFQEQGDFCAALYEEFLRREASRVAPKPTMAPVKLPSTGEMTTDPEEPCPVPAEAGRAADREVATTAPVLQKLGALPTDAEKLAEGQKIYASCTSCHHHKDEIGDRLKAKAYRDLAITRIRAGDMPQGQDLTDYQKDAIVQFLLKR